MKAKPTRAEMIRYTLKCPEGHEFDGWFRSSGAFEDQRSEGLLACAVCGSDRVEKALMAPAVPAKAPGAPAPCPSLAPEDPRTKALAALRRRIETTSDYVGPRFAAEARRIHDGEASSRPIWGEASGDEARKLREDGIPAVPIPWMSRRDD